MAIIKLELNNGDKLETGISDEFAKQLFSLIGVYSREKEGGRNSSQD